MPDQGPFGSVRRAILVTAATGYIGSRVLAPVVGGLLLQEVGRWAPGLLAGLVIAALVPYVLIRLTRPLEDGRLQLVGETTYA